MKKKKYLIMGIIGFILILIAGIGLIFALNPDKTRDNDIEEETKEETKKEKETSEATPLLYKVTKDGSNTTIYLFGSIHMADDRAYPMRDEIMEAYIGSEYLAVEFDLVTYEKDLERQIADVKKMLYIDGTKISDHFSEESYNKLIEYLEKNKSYNKAYESYRPVFFYSLVSNIIGEKSGLDSNKGIDDYFLKDAHKRNKKILEVESSDYQMDMLSSYSDKMFEAIIMYSIESEEEGIQELKDLYENWLKGDGEALAEEDEEEVSEDALEEYEGIEEELEAFNNELVVERNEKMLETVKGYMEADYNTFVVVGALHIVGDTGLAKGLEKAGYKVEIVEYK